MGIESKRQLPIKFGRFITHSAKESERVQREETKVWQTNKNLRILVTLSVYDDCLQEIA